MAKTLKEPLEAWQKSERSNPLLLRWKIGEKPVLKYHYVSKEAGVVPYSSVKTSNVLLAGGFEVRLACAGLASDWFTRDQRAVVERSSIKYDADASTPSSVAICKLIRYDGDDAECEMSVLGYDVPRVSLPKWVLDQKGVKIGSRFCWFMSNSPHISPRDIDPGIGVAPRLTEEEVTSLNTLYNKAIHDRELDSDEWEEYTGPGK